MFNFGKLSASKLPGNPLEKAVEITIFSDMYPDTQQINGCRSRYQRLCENNPQIGANSLSSQKNCNYSKFEGYYLCMNDRMVGFSELYRRYAADVYRFAFWLSGDGDVANDIVSETFVKVWLSKKDVQLQTVKAFLFTIARNEFLKSLRSNKRRSEIPEALLDAALNADEQFAQTESLLRTLRHLRQLPEIDRAVLILHAMEGLPQQEIATILNLSLSAVKVKIFRSRRKLLELALNSE